MPSKKHDTIWEAEPHTIAKITILESYLHVWFQIMGRSMAGKDILYIDGFAGPGEYTNCPKGSPIAALNAAKEALRLSGGQWKAGTIHCVFIEANVERFDHLQKVIGQLAGISRVKIHLLHTTFTEGLKHLKSEIPSAFSKSWPLFVFIDPFGATGAPFSTVAEILRSPYAEVLINVDADGIVRIFRAKEEASSDDLLKEIFGNDEWKTTLKDIHNFNAQCLQVLNLYKLNLRRLQNIRYAFAFEMRSRSRSLNYYLVFASQHYLGLEKMKEAMKTVDQTGNYHFSDAYVNQQILFRFEKPENYSPLMFAQFKGKVVQYDELRDFALNETPFINPKGMLKDLENKDLITVSSRVPNRRMGTFNEENIVKIIFKGGEGNAH